MAPRGMGPRAAVRVRMLPTTHLRVRMRERCMQHARHSPLSLALEARLWRRNMTAIHSNRAAAWLRQVLRPPESEVRLTPNNGVTFAASFISHTHTPTHPPPARCEFDNGGACRLVREQAGEV
eukprot:scaffold31184_cov174-Isochrysis_galbana.AAC.1